MQEIEKGIKTMDIVDHQMTYEVPHAIQSGSIDDLERMREKVQGQGPWLEKVGCIAAECGSIVVLEWVQKTLQGPVFFCGTGFTFDDYPEIADKIWREFTSVAKEHGQNDVLKWLDKNRLYYK